MADIHILKSTGSDNSENDASSYHVADVRFGGDGGDGQGMEARVTKLENDMTDIRVSLARIEAKLDSKIDYKWLTVYVLGIVAVVMRDEIRTWLVAAVN